MGKLICGLTRFLLVSVALVGLSCGGGSGASPMGGNDGQHIGGAGGGGNDGQQIGEAGGGGNDGQQIGGAGGGAPAGSGGQAGQSGGAAGAAVNSGGTPVVVTDPSAHAAAVAALSADLASDQPTDASSFPRHAGRRTAGPPLPYDPLAAQGLDLLTAGRVWASATASDRRSVATVSSSRSGRCSRRSFTATRRSMPTTCHFTYRSTPSFTPSIARTTRR